MDKNSSLLCLKFSLIAGNSAVICLGMAGFLTGLITPNAMAHLGVTGSQLALVSAAAVVIAAAGFIGALREHFCLLLTYALCIVSAFVFRLVWSLAGPLHHSGRFVLDTTASLTLLSSLAKIFLMIFAIMLALAAQNSLPLTKEKLFSFKDMLKPKKKHGKDKIDAKKMSNQSLKKIPSRPRSLKIPVQDNGIYVSSASNNVYESGRRRSPNRMLMMVGNGHHGHHHGHHGHHHSNGGSSRSRRYMVSGVGYSAPMSPDVSHSSFSQDSNNNHKQQHLAKTLSNPSLMSPAPPLPPERAATMERRHHHHQQPAQRGHRNYSSQRDYIHYRSPSPPAAVETSVKQQSAPKFTNQPFYNPYRSSTLPKTTTSTSSAAAPPPPPSTNIPKSSSSQVVEPMSPPPITTSASQRSWSMPRSVLYSPGSGYTSPLSPKPSVSPPPVVTTTSTYTRPIPASRSSITPISRAPVTSSSYSASRLFASSPTITSTTASTSTPIRSSLFTSGYRPSGSKTLPTTTASNLSQTRNLFSNFTSPLYTTTTVTGTTESDHRIRNRPTSPSTTLTSISSSYQRSSTPQRTSGDPLLGLKSPTPSPNQASQPQHFHWSISSSTSRTPTPPVVTTTSTTSAATAPKYKPWVSLRPGAIANNNNESHPSSIITSSSSSTNLFAVPSSSYVSKTYPRNYTSSSTTTTSITTTTSTTSGDKQRYWYSTSTTNIGPPASTTTTTSSSANLFARVYPKTYEEYVKSYRYPESSGNNSINSRIQPDTNTNTIFNTSSTTSNRDGGLFSGYRSLTTGTTNSFSKTTTTTTTSATTSSTGSDGQPQKGSLFYYTERTMYHQT